MVAEDAALEDSIYYLEKRLMSHSLDAETFLKVKKNLFFFFFYNANIFFFHSRFDLWLQNNLRKKLLFLKFTKSKEIRDSSNNNN